jgi:hypothetical protein
MTSLEGAAVPETPAVPAPASSAAPGPSAPPAAPAPPDPSAVPAPPADPGPSAAPAPPTVAAPPTTDIVAGPGGVMTDEVGVVTGELTLRSEIGAEGSFVVKVQYKEAEEWYSVTGAKGTLKDPADLAAVHAVVAGILNRPEG